MDDSDANESGTFADQIVWPLRRLPGV